MLINILVNRYKSFINFLLPIVYEEVGKCLCSSFINIIWMSCN